MIQYDTILKWMHLMTCLHEVALCPHFFSRCGAHFPIFKDLRLVQQSNKGRLSAVSSRRDSAHSFKSANSISVLADGCWFSTRKGRMLVMWLLRLLLLLLLVMVNCRIGDDILPYGFGISNERKYILEKWESSQNNPTISSISFSIFVGTMIQICCKEL